MAFPGSSSDTDDTKYLAIIMQGLTSVDPEVRDAALKKAIAMQEKIKIEPSTEQHTSPLAGSTPIKMRPPQIPQLTPEKVEAFPQQAAGHLNLHSTVQKEASAALHESIEESPAAVMPSAHSLPQLTPTPKEAGLQEEHEKAKKLLQEEIQEAKNKLKEEQEKIKKLQCQTAIEGARMKVLQQHEQPVKEAHALLQLQQQREEAQRMQEALLKDAQLKAQMPGQERLPAAAPMLPTAVPAHNQPGVVRVFTSQTHNAEYIACTQKCKARGRAGTEMAKMWQDKSKRPEVFQHYMSVWASGFVSGVSGSVRHCVYLAD